MDHLILTVPQPSYLVAAGMLAAALGECPRPREAAWKYRPAPVRVLTPLGEMGEALESWRALPEDQRPKLWVLCFDERGLRDIARKRNDRTSEPGRYIYQKIIADFTQAGLEVVVGPERQGDAIEAVKDLIQQQPEKFPSAQLLRGMAQSAERRFDRVKLLINRAVSEDRVSDDNPDDGTYAGDLTAWLQKRILPLCLPNATVNDLRDCLTNLKLRDQVTQHFNAYDCDVLGSFDDTARILAMRANEVFWSIKIRGPSRTAEFMREHAKKAVSAIKSGKPVLMPFFDRQEAQRLAKYVIEQAEQGDVVSWQGTIPDEPVVVLVSPKKEIDLYQTLATHGRNKPFIWEIPPLDERAADIPLMAAVMLSKIHHERSVRGAPGGFAQSIDKLVWLAGRHWPHGSAQLESWLQQTVKSRRSPWKADARIPLHPGIPHPITGARISAETARMQTLRWQLGSQRQRVDALTALNLNTKEMPTNFADTGKGHLPKGLPRRLVWREGECIDRWLDPELEANRAGLAIRPAIPEHQARAKRIAQTRKRMTAKKRAPAE